jgi:hypothetical protein
MTREEPASELCDLLASGPVTRQACQTLTRLNMGSGDSDSWKEGKWQMQRDIYCSLISQVQGYSEFHFTEQVAKDQRGYGNCPSHTAGELKAKLPCLNSAVS